MKRKITELSDSALQAKSIFGNDEDKRMVQQEIERRKNKSDIKLPKNVSYEVLEEALNLAKKYTSYEISKLIMLHNFLNRNK